MRGNRSLLRITPLTALLAVLVLGDVFPAPATAQPAKKSGEKKPPAGAAPLTLETVKQELERLDANKTLKDEAKARIKALFEKSKEQFQSAANSEKTRSKLEAEKRRAAQDEAEARRELEIPIAAPKAADANDLDLKTLDERLKAAKALKLDAENKIKKWEGEQKDRLARKELVPKRRIEAENELKKIQADLKAPLPSGEPPEYVAALRFLQRAQKHALEKEIAALSAELPAYNETDTAVKQQLDAARHQLQRADKQVKFWEQKLDEHRGFEAREQVQQASTVVENYSNAKLPEPLVDLAKQNLQLARQRTGDSGTVAEFRGVRRKLSDVEAELKRLESERESLEKKLQIPDIQGDIGPLLVLQRRRLPNTHAYKRGIGERSTSLSKLRLQIINTQGMQKQLGELKTKIEKQLAGDSRGLDRAARSRREEALKSLIAARKKILDSLHSDYNSLLEQQSQLTAKEHQLIEAATKFRGLIDKHILWIPTTLPFGWRHLEDAGDAVAWLVNPVAWQKAGETLLDSLFARPVSSTLAVLLLALALFKHPTLKRNLIEMGGASSKGFTQPYLLTVKSLALTILLSAIWPAVLWFTGRRLLTYSGTSAFAESVGMALTVVAAALLTFEFLRRTFRRNGLADAHFRWKNARLSVLRRHLRWFMLSALPGLFLYVLIDDFGEEDYIASLGRIVLVSLLLLVAGFLAIVFRNPQVKLPFSDALGIEHAVAAKPASVSQVVAYLAVVLFPVGLAVAAIAGYQYTAAFLAWKFLCTAWLGLGLLIAHAMAMRWLYHVRGKLALEQSQAALAAKKEAEAQAAAAQAPATDPPRDPFGQAIPRDDSNGSSLTPPGQPLPDAAPATVAPAAAIVPPPKAATADLAAINAQTRRLLQIAIGCGAVLGLWLIWIDVLPALKFLDYPLWSHQVESTRMVTSPTDKTVVPQTITVIQAFTLGKLILTIAIVAVVFVAAGNLPGLLEVALLQKLPIDSGARYAVTSLSRYTIYAVGIVTAFNLMGVGWSKVQWLIAALSVGLGFGLQEIVANFVSGIILLFERPLRVGDIVTVGDVSGVVTRIQIRATTIRNWDRKEYIVPNKELVTGKLMNWTLSDTVNRIVVNVGVKYGTDADRVREILLAVANDHPEILADPPAIASFEGFGDSALNFVLRCYLPDLSNRLVVIHQLHAETQRRLQSAGIEIPFPQRDLHVRSDATRGNGEPAGEREAEHVSAR